MSILNSIKEKVKVAQENAAKQKEAENARRAEEDHIISEVEQLPVFKGYRKNSFWLVFKVQVTPKNFQIVLNRIDSANEKIKTELMPSEYREAWEELNYYMSRLAQIENKVPIRGEMPSYVLRRMKLQYTSAVNEFLDRYQKQHLEERIKPLKTERGKINRVNKEFLAGLDPLWSNLTETSKQYAEELAKLEIEQIKQGKI